jgi:hypothetical protein
MKIVFHENSLCIAGTTVALFDYAYYCKHLYGFDVSIMYNYNHFANDPSVIKKFTDEFKNVVSYGKGLGWSWPPDANTTQQLQHNLDELSPDVFFMEKGGPWDNIISKNCKNWVHAIAKTRQDQVYGDKFFVGSKWLSDVSDGIDYVPYMVNLPNVAEDLRDELGIPKNAIVFGRNGGAESFDLEFAKKAVIDTLSKRNDVYFLFQGTNKFIDHPRVIHIPASPDLVQKVKFINTTNALLHARQLGESFGQTCAEFSTKNKPVITWIGSPERNHILVLGERGIYYSDYDQLLKILLTFEPNDSKDWNCYQDYTPEIVMEKFKKCYID